jgi:holo-[acyl-carrier protein] synthase
MSEAEGMIVGIGVDIVEISGFRFRAKRNPKFIERTFNIKEIEYCQAQGDPYSHFAIKFAVKEAVMKALGTGWANGVAFPDIIVSRRIDGCFIIELKGVALRKLNECKGQINISVSKTNKLAVAYAILKSCSP